MITYLASKKEKATESCDICIIGGGAAGCELAYHLKDSGQSIVVIESGFLNFDLETQRLNRFKQLGHVISTPNYDEEFTHKVAKQLDCRYRALGGSLNVWGRRWMMLDPDDFLAKPSLGIDEWPISDKDLLPYYTAIAEDYELGEFFCVEKLKEEFHVPTLRAYGQQANLFIKQNYPSQLVLHYYGFLERRLYHCNQ